MQRPLPHWTEINGKIIEVDIDVDTVTILISQNKRVTIKLPQWQIVDKAILQSLEVGIEISILRTDTQYLIQTHSEGFRARKVVKTRSPARAKHEGGES